MIHTETFDTPAAAIDYFNAPANSHLRMVSLLPPTSGGSYTALYETTLDGDRLRALDERIMGLWQLDDDTKTSLGVSRSILAENVVPLSIVNNKLRGYACFQGMDTPARAAWIRDNAPAVRCSLLSRHEARAKHGCAVELLVIEA